MVAATLRTNGTSIDRFTLRFSEDMASVGGGDSATDDGLRGRRRGPLADPTTYVWDYASLPAGRDDLQGDTQARSQDACRPLCPRHHYLHDRHWRALCPRGPARQRQRRDRGGDQSFFVATNGPVDRGSVAAGAYCAGDGIGERIPVDLLPANTVERVLVALGKDDWRSRNFLETAGIPQPLPVAKRDRAAALANIVALKCRRPLPPGRDMALVWAGGIRSAAGRTAGEDKRFDFTVRKEFTARLTCSRVNAHAGCSPVEAISVEFTAPVPRASALALRLDVGGKQLAPKEDKSDHSATLASISFEPPLPASITAKLVMPEGLKDESGRPLANARRFPLDVAIAEPPPLVKFAAPFGILETSQGGVLPVTVRAVEPSLGQAVKAIPGGTARIDASDGKIAEWVHKVAKAQNDDYREETVGGAKVTVNHTGDTALLPRGMATPMRLSLPGGGKQFEVIGIPLTKPGFYVVELASPILGQALLGRKATRYVNAAALVTDMAVHFKWGREASLAWVTCWRMVRRSPVPPSGSPTAVPASSSALARPMRPAGCWSAVAAAVHREWL